MTVASSSVQESAINWNHAWQLARRKKTTKSNGPTYWNHRAPSFADHTRKSEYSRKFMQVLAAQKHWSVLDVGCGAGTLAIPLASKVRRVTAIDFSEVMIGLLRKRCAELDLSNVNTSVVAWEDDWQDAGIMQHDVAIASRSLTVEDLGAALLKLDRIARHRVVISSLVDDGPFDRRIFDAIGRELDRGPDYIYAYNLLHQMGIYADVSFVVDTDRRKSFSSLDEAVAGYDWMIDNLTSEEKERLRSYLASHLVRKGDGWTLDYQHVVRWAVISWSK
ncbi:class I SAM-dependent methyltransferase [Desulfogranum japonicum]|uniref:class I SAM-dependent methyltransferase n=1 Tax=Desulfogranum japonicum TaxID=231447 RepID=UPI00040E8D25|nr:class I SAM-dependent methyltransferase [Desulfogranum japonicum]